MPADKLELITYCRRPVIDATSKHMGQVTTSYLEGLAGSWNYEALSLERYPESGSCTTSSATLNTSLKWPLGKNLSNTLRFIA